MVKIAAIGGTDANGRTNYQGKLYDFEGETTVEMTDYGQGKGGDYYKEPSNMYDYEEDGTFTLYESATNFTTITWTENLYQESFNKMAESVAKYKGFYVGRYEMGLDANGVAQSSSEATLATGSNVGNWFKCYEKALTYSTSGVISEMIWGCQYDAMLRWMVQNNINVNETNVSGALNNIYGFGSESKWEWTQETMYCKVLRDSSDSGPAWRYDYDAGSGDDYWGTRLSLYVEV